MENFNKLIHFLREFEVLYNKIFSFSQEYQKKLKF